VLFDALPVYLSIVVGLAFVLLVLVFRSLVVPLLATIGFLLSILATLGVTVSLVQNGVFGLFDPQPVMSVMPTLLIGIVFGLAMDYQVFLTTRMREAYVHGMDARDAVVDGFRHSGRVVTAAALIMISVFAAFAFQDNALIKTIGIGLATAVLLDAFLVRMVLVPAVLIMLGRRAWWIPGWLDRILPSVDVEGEKLSKAPVPVYAGRHRASKRPGAPVKGARTPDRTKVAEPGYDAG
jgi:RND superfamily putative drug exporter